MNRIYLLLPLVLLIANNANALECGTPPTQIGTVDLKKVDGNVSVLAKLAGSGDIVYEAKKVQRDLYHNYPDANKLLIDVYMLYMFCTVIRDSTELSDRNKITELINIKYALLTRNADTTNMQASLLQGGTAKKSLPPAQPATNNKTNIVGPNDEIATDSVISEQGVCSPFFGLSEFFNDDSAISQIPNGTILHLKSNFLLPKEDKRYYFSKDPYIHLAFKVDKENNRLMRKGNQIVVSSTGRENTSSYWYLLFKPNKAGINHIEFFPQNITIGQFKKSIQNYFDLILPCPKII